MLNLTFTRWHMCLLLSESTQSRDLHFALEAFKASLRTYFRNIYYRVILFNRHRSFDWSWLKINQKVFCSSIWQNSALSTSKLTPSERQSKYQATVCKLFIEWIAGRISVGRRVICCRVGFVKLQMVIRVDFSDANVVRATIWISKEV